MDEGPKCIVSACLGFKRCRYNGQVVASPFIEKLSRFVEIETVCPEVAVGLGTPREPLRMIIDNGKRRLYQPATEHDVTDKMISFMREFLDGTGEIDGFILKNRSPSCGIGDVKIYHGYNPKTNSARGEGIFGSFILENFPNAAIEDEGRLNNYALREHFLIKLFVRKAFREVIKQGTIQAVIDFHTRNKLLFMAYNQSKTRKLGKLLASYNKKNEEQIVNGYEELLAMLFAKPYRYSSMINVLQHAFGGLSPYLSKEEKSFFLNTVEEYRDERVPLSVPVHILNSWAIRHNNSYLLHQTFISPYPKELVEITDSGKGRTL